MTSPSTNLTTRAVTVTGPTAPPDSTSGSVESDIEPRRVRLMTYNVHAFVGSDSVYDPERVARVIESCGANVVALQEVDFGRGPTAEPSVLDWLAKRLRMRAHFTFTRDGKRGHFGNAVLTPFELELVAEGMLPRRRDEARAVQWLKVVAPHFQLQLMNTHLSVKLRERRAQVEALLGAEWLVRAASEQALVVCGDFNSSPFSPVYRKLSRHLTDVQRGSTRRLATWPARLPFWRIDHVFVSRGVEIRNARVVDDPLSRAASDHLPIVTDLQTAPER